MSEYKIQVSAKHPNGHIVLVRGNDADEVKEALSGLLNTEEEVTTVMEVVRDAFYVGDPRVSAQAAAGGRVVSSGGGAPAGAAGPQGDGPVCSHGAMQFKSGQKNGRTWKAYFCPSPKGTEDQCDPQWVK